MELNVKSEVARRCCSRRGEGKVGAWLELGVELWRAGASMWLLARHACAQTGPLDGLSTSKGIITSVRAG